MRSSVPNPRIEIIVRAAPSSAAAAGADLATGFPHRAEDAHTLPGFGDPHQPAAQSRRMPSSAFSSVGAGFARAIAGCPSRM